MAEEGGKNLMEFLGIIAGMFFLVSPIYFKLFKIEHRLTKIETILNGDMNK